MLQEQNPSCVSALIPAWRIERQSSLTEESSRKSEVRSWKLEVGSGKLEVGNRKSEIGSQKWEVGSKKWEVGGQKSNHAAFSLNGQKSEIRSSNFDKSEV